MVIATGLAGAGSISTRQTSAAGKLSGFGPHVRAAGCGTPGLTLQSTLAAALRSDGEQATLEAVLLGTTTMVTVRLNPPPLATIA
jgi:hypothetical protein